MLTNKIDQFDRQIAEILAQLAYCIDPKIITFIQERNAEELGDFKALFRDRIPINDYLYTGSACVFPGVKRYVSGEGKKKKYNRQFNAIIDDNIFPRHIWSYLATGNAYSGPLWKTSGLCEFELAHVFSHKDSELKIEKTVFDRVQDNLVPSGDFTSAANVILLPKGTIRPTDNSPKIKAVFYKRYLELYGPSSIRGRHNLKENSVPEWYKTLKWNTPWLPPDWKKNIIALMAYRTKRIKAILQSTPAV